MSPNYATYPSLADRTVFITGGADGIGSAMVTNFARQGAKVAFVDKNVEKAAATIERAVAAHGISQIAGGGAAQLLHPGRVGPLEGVGLDQRHFIDHGGLREV